jgi:hypothetical protein
VGSTNKFVPSTDITYTNVENVQTDLESHLKDTDNKLSSTATLSVYSQHVRILDTPDAINLFTE